MRAIVLGLAISGTAAADYLKMKGYQVIGVDRAQKVVEGISCNSDTLTPQLEGIDLLVKSPGIPQSHPWAVQAVQNGIPVVGEIDLALKELAAQGKKVLAITGSNGKTTTTLLAAHFLQLAGQKAIAAGNVGIPLIAQVHSDHDVYVVELSSFQLEAIQPLPVFDGAVILNITPNHLDRHPSFEDYVRAKWRIASCLKKGAPLHVTEQLLFACPPEIDRSLIKKVETFLTLGYRISCKPLFPHDLENAAAAYALTSVPLAILEQGIKSFVRPPHRLEIVREVAGVTYINDSKATSVDAVVKAVQALDKPLLLIAGGVDKGGAYSDWIPHFKGKVKCLYALGEAAERMERELIPHLDVQRVATLEEGVKSAAQKADRGDVVLLSPGCSSYDQFKDYQHRGNRFKEIVLGLTE